jgi:NAD+ diphosphatase
MEALAYVFAGSDIFLENPESERASVRLETLGDLPTIERRPFEWMGIQGMAIGLDEAGAALALDRGLVRMPIRQAIAHWPEGELRPAFKALALLNWLGGMKYCCACGASLSGARLIEARSHDEEEGSALVCPSCGRAHFPRISPAVIVLVKKEGKALLARNARFPGRRFGLLAGFVEAGETLEETAAREVREEAGIEIADLRYLVSQPWPFPDSLMFAFTAEWVGGEARPDGREIVELLWCGPDELPDIPPRGSVARRLIDAFVKGET